MPKFAFISQGADIFFKGILVFGIGEALRLNQHRSKDQERSLLRVSKRSDFSKPEVFKAVDELEADQNYHSHRVLPHLELSKDLRPKKRRLETLRVDLLRVATAIQADPSLTCRKISQVLSLPQGRITHLIRLLKDQPIEKIRNVDDQLSKLHRAEAKIKAFYESHFESNQNARMTLLQTFHLFGVTHDPEATVSFSRFRKTLLSLGLRYKSIKYLPKLKYKPSFEAMESFLTTYLHILTHEDQFELIFVDESALVPENFKRKAWFAKKTSNVIKTKIKYEKISLFAAITRERLISFQFLQSGHSSSTFAHFISSTLEVFQHSIEPKKSLVIILDNSTIHHPTILHDICAESNCILFFLLPSVPELMPIELLWEYLKRPMRSMITYAK